MISSFRLNERVGKIATPFLNYSWSSTRKQVAQFKKMMDRMAAREKKGKNLPSLLQKGTLFSAYGNEGTSQRITALNKIYMENLTMMASNGTWGKHLGDLGIEISKVKLAKGLNFLNIYWITRRTDVPEDILNETLMAVLPELQQQMGSLRFTAKVPFLKFVKDLRLEREIHLEKIFETADFGKDFQPTYGRKVVTPDLTQKPGEIPEMRQNILGLDHAAIKTRIATQILRYKAIKINRHENEFEEKKHEAPQKLIQFNKQEFMKFYKRKRILELKLSKMYEQKDCFYFSETADVIDEFEDDDDDDDDEFQFEAESEYDTEYEAESEDEFELEDEHKNEQ